MKIIISEMLSTVPENHECCIYFTFPLPVHNLDERNDEEDGGREEEEEDDEGNGEGIGDCNDDDEGYESEGEMFKEFFEAIWPLPGNFSGDVDTISKSVIFGKVIENSNLDHFAEYHHFWNGGTIIFHRSNIRGINTYYT